MADIINTIANILIVIACLKYLGFFAAILQIVEGDEVDYVDVSDNFEYYYGPVDGSAVELDDMIDKKAKADSLFQDDNFSSAYGVYGMSVMDGELGDNLEVEAGVEE